MPSPADRDSQKWERLFFVSFFVAIALLLAQIVLDWAFLDWPRAGAWTAAGVFSILQGLAERRAGRDGAGLVFRGLACFCFAALAVV